ncbi:MAG: type II toxin-antitoxin system mRNA interferase toxin, RelE/StbE family [Desulfobacteraceae bacterium]|nr:type II toxin-antitoxin system mRNA interferase toxin, RelE/StbE family [Desulfobacteraceae bacterium]
MWEIFEHRSLVRKLPKIPVDILKRYEKWKDIVMISGPDGLKRIKGFHDESLKGKWQGARSSRLSLQYRLIYKIVKNQLYVQVMDINPHDYRKK